MLYQVSRLFMCEHIDRRMFFLQFPLHLQTFILILGLRDAVPEGYTRVAESKFPVVQLIHM